MELLTTLVGTVAGILTVAFGIPQAARVLRTGSAEGVSRTAWLLTYALCLPWLAYGIHIADWVLIISNAASMIAPGVILLAASQKGKAAVAVRLALLTVALLVICLIVPASVSGMIAAGALFFTRLPQVFSSYRAWRDYQPTVVSTATWTISLTFSSLWVIYGVLNADWVQISGNSAAMLLSLLVLAFEVSGARRANR